MPPRTVALPPLTARPSLPAAHRQIGDHWCTYYRFELQFGTAETQAAVVKGCVEAEPNRGEHWCRIAKHPLNLHDKPDTLLKKVRDAGRADRGACP